MPAKKSPAKKPTVKKPGFFKRIFGSSKKADKDFDFIVLESDNTSFMQKKIPPKLLEKQIHEEEIIEDTATEIDEEIIEDTATEIDEKIIEDTVTDIDEEIVELSSELDEKETEEETEKIDDNIKYNEDQNNDLPEYEIEPEDIILEGFDVKTGYKIMTSKISTKDNNRGKEKDRDK